MRNWTAAEAETALLQGRIAGLEYALEIAKEMRALVPDDGRGRELQFAVRDFDQWLAEYDSARSTPSPHSPNESVHIPLVEPEGA